MDQVATLRQRKKQRVDEIRAGFAALRTELAGYGRTHSGKFWIYGSAATGKLHFESDIDILVDFAPEETAPAIGFVETRCAELGLRVDVQPKAWCTADFLGRVAKTALVLP